MRRNTPDNLWRIEVSNPQELTGWHTVLKFTEELYSKYERLTDSLNRMDVSFQVRIARDTD